MCVHKIKQNTHALTSYNNFEKKTKSHATIMKQHTTHTQHAQTHTFNTHPHTCCKGHMQQGLMAANRHTFHTLSHMPLDTHTQMSRRRTPPTPHVAHNMLHTPTHKHIYTHAAHIFTTH